MKTIVKNPFYLILNLQERKNCQNSKFGLCWQKRTNARYNNVIRDIIAAHHGHTRQWGCVGDVP